MKYNSPMRNYRGVDVGSIANNLMGRGYSISSSQVAREAERHHVSESTIGEYLIRFGCTQKGIYYSWGPKCALLEG